MRMLLFVILILLLFEAPSGAAQERQDAPEKPAAAKEETAPPVADEKEETSARNLEFQIEGALSGASLKKTPEPGDEQKKKNRRKLHRRRAESDGVDGPAQKIARPDLGLIRKIDYFIDEDGDGISDGRSLRPGLSPAKLEHMRKRIGKIPPKRRPVPLRHPVPSHKKKGSR